MGPLTLIIGLRLLALAAGLRHNAEIGQPGLCFSAYGHKFGINHLATPTVQWRMRTAAQPDPGLRSFHRWQFTPSFLQLKPPTGSPCASSSTGTRTASIA